MRPAESVSWRRFAALPLGAASALAFAPFEYFPVLWLTLGGLYALLGPAADGGLVRQGAITAGLFGLGGFLAGVSWIFVSLSTFGGMPAPGAAFATFVFCAGMALYPALAGALFARLAPPAGARRALVFAALWTLAEWLRGWFLTGFPWLAVGYSQTPPSPLAGFAPIAGVYGVSFLTVLTGAFLAEAAFGGCRRNRLPMAAVPAVLLLAGVALSGHGWTTPQGETLRVALLQGNIAQDMKWRPEELEESLLAYYYLMRDNPARLTVLPEAALPMFLSDVPAEYLGAMGQLAARQDGDLIFGVVTGDWSRYANSAVSLGASGTQRYDKSHLVPFGEFTPPGFAWFMEMVNIPMSSFTPGEEKQTPFSAGGQKIAVNICYEDAFGAEIVRALPEATLLLNLSNMAWFGDSLAPAQHLQIARMRALETGRMMLRATNTGMTAIIGADGAIRAALPPFTRAALTGEVTAHAGSTPFARWGNTPAVAASLLPLLAFARRRKTPS
ncbi:MAG: apolipoprotein N-acyltransferase [Candidatus Accumulibacter sp.]|jgi:apolipoprotein N-acyltransferase|nr:apolipoprotein N-acyltransferase [Accumulibacter sp.]